MKLKHPDSKHNIEVRDEDAETYLSQGWTAVGKKSEKDADDK